MAIAMAVAIMLVAIIIMGTGRWPPASITVCPAHHDCGNLHGHRQV